MTNIFRWRRPSGRPHFPYAAGVLLLLLLLVAIQPGRTMAQAEGKPPAAGSRESKEQAALNRSHAAQILTAQGAAENWLKLVDEGKYEATWKQLAPLARAQVTAGAWKEQVGATRESYGPLLSRRRESADYKTSLPGAPDGEYIVMQYASSFVHKAHAVETLVLQHSGEDWQPAGYLLR